MSLDPPLAPKKASESGAFLEVGSKDSTVSSLGTDAQWSSGVSSPNEDWSPKVTPTGASLLERRQGSKLQVDTKMQAQLASERILAATRDPCVPEGPPQKKIQGTNDDAFKFTITKQDEHLSEELQEAIDVFSDDLFHLPFSVSVALPFVDDTPLVGISSGFTKLTGYTQEQILGKNCRFLLKDVPSEEISDEVRQNARRYCRAAHLKNLTTMSNCTLIQRNARSSGELFWNLFMMTFVPGPNKRNYIVGLQLDLGPDIKPYGDAQGAIESHREHLLLVQRLMFRKSPQAPLEYSSAAAANIMSRDFSIVSEKIKAWLSFAEGSSSAFQEWGTLPWVAWPTCQRFALVDGGVGLLRLEADESPEGAAAMSIFPVAKKQRSVSFKVMINEVSDQWPGNRLPSLGFTEVAPAQLDDMGGLPRALEFTAKSMVVRGDGRLFRRSKETNHSCDVGIGDGTGIGNAVPRAPADEVQQSSVQASFAFPYEVAVGDCLECTWGSGFVSVSVNDVELFRIDDSDELGVTIGDPPRKVPLFAIVDCCYAACKVTLMA
eukprot:gnl/TRDRNA2_/TRDRNA2_177454_c3_seq6.p1 gnl/TRDRNA2_/TRDRNA2_177454_c3~~gnl/TRDRNA2_/TRDRNA2_177454_c3_seq6.p1  ORF type:complete len:596 (+),score=94.72 gnl/TRDRNA2_/TRDRNA2_177454_c3_seq6:146-1789(+)